jgi:hypothetical protein
VWALLKKVQMKSMKDAVALPMVVRKWKNK